MTHHEMLKDKDYNLVSALYHALQGAETAQVYMQDAEREGDKEASQFFHDLKEQYKKLAEKSKKLLSERI
jgi:uncharacterized protein YaaW (UPF0174 family)